VGAFLASGSWLAMLLFVFIMPISTQVRCDNR
jgi:hypothetical protein